MIAMTANLEKRTILPGENTLLADVWELKEQIRRSDDVLRQARGYFEREYRNHTAYLLQKSDPEVQADIAAFAVIHDDGYLSLFGVDPDLRRQGLGICLLDAFLDVHDIVTLHTRASNQGAIEFYEDAGFRVEERVGNYYQDGGDALLLQLTRRGATERSFAP